MRFRKLFPVLLVFLALTFPLGLASGQTTNPSTTDQSLSFKFFSAALAFGASAIGAGWAVSKAGAAGLAGTAERPEIRTTAIIITALGEAIAIYGIVIAILILGQSA